MASDKKHWMADAFKNASGQLRKKTHTKAGHNISSGALRKAEHAPSLKTRRQANLADIARKANHRKSR